MWCHEGAYKVIEKMPVNVLIEENILIKEYIKGKLKKRDKMTVKEKEGKNMKMRSLDEWINDTEPLSKIKRLSPEEVEKHPIFKFLLKSKKEYNPTDIADFSHQINSLNKNLKKVCELNRHSELVKNIFHPEHFQGARTELEIACYYLYKDRKVELEPPATESGKMDLSVKLKDRFVHFECYHPNIKEMALNKGERDYVNKSLPFAIRKIFGKVKKRQIIKGEPNILLIDISEKKWETSEGKTMNKIVINRIVKGGEFKNHPEYSAIVVYDRRYRKLRVIKNPDARLSLTDEEIQIIG